MKFIPYDKFQIVVNVPLSQARERLIENVGPKRFWGIFSSAKEPRFNGKVDDTSFRIRRNIHYQNSFLPIMNGSFEPHPTGTQISVKMHLHPFVAIFLILWIGFALVFTLSVSANVVWAEIGQLMVMVGFALIITYLGFWFEAKQSKAVFKEIFEKITANTPLEPIR